MEPSSCAMEDSIDQKNVCTNRSGSTATRRRNHPLDGSQKSSELHERNPISVEFNRRSVNS
eukprot:1973240-Amphidinium_carterae.2